METSNTPACKAIINEGPRKGNSCEFPPSDNGYCGRHIRNNIYDHGISEGKKWCRFFFRGCNNNVTNSLTCEMCLKKKHEGNELCKHEGCTNHTKNTDFCKKHERDIYHIKEKQECFKYCDIKRGCFNICNGEKRSCDDCLEKERIKNKERFDKRKELHNALKETHCNKRICVDCGSEFKNYLTFQNKESLRCLKCKDTVHNQDLKRVRIRNEKYENFINKEKYYKVYINAALKREYDFLLNFEEFSQIVDKECFYCHFKKEEEVNGIDRVDNFKGYTKENSVTCCEICNRIKHVYHPLYFIEKCKIIGLEQRPNKKFYNKWSQYYSRHNHNYINYKKTALEKRNLEFEITQSQWDTLTREQCYLCGYKSIGGVGLDRVDNTIRKYTIENVKPCCGSCNIMKGELSLEVLKEKCRKISEVWQNTEYFEKISIPKGESKNLQTTPDSRKVWKALGLYYTILNNEETQFYEFYKIVLKEKELEELCFQVKKDPKEKALEYLSKFLRMLKARRKRII